MFKIRTLGLLLAAGTMMATAAMAGPEITPAAEGFPLGKFQAFALRDFANALPNDGKVFGTDVGPGKVGAFLKTVGIKDDQIKLSVDTLLVRTPDRVVLLDTGLGPKVGGVLMQSLAKAGFSPDQVTDILITHGHSDHIGGLLTTDGKPAFPKATIRMAAAEWAWIQSQPENAALVTTLSPAVKTFEPGAVFVPGFRSVPLAGHTPGHVGYEIVSGTARLLDVGDTAHSSVVSLGHPEWGNGYDTDQDRGRTVRETELAKLAASHETIFAPHFPYPGVGAIVKAGSSYAWKPSTLPQAAKVAR
ncbi:MAG: MBL fold metallo-hydrolase [Rhizobiaceae bacterium]|nr:MBL fold metallo-hydrolase [Rhizobiaceae bacterium]